MAVEWSMMENIRQTSPDWQFVELKKFSSGKKHCFVNGPFGSDLLSSELVDQGMPVIYIRDIKNGRYQRKSKAFVTPEKFNSLIACQVSLGDVVIAKVGDPPCEAALYDSTEAGVVTQDVIRIKTMGIETSAFLSYLLNSDIGKRQIKRIKITGTRERVSLTDFKLLKLPFPSSAQQRKIAKILQTWDRAITTTEKLIDASKQQKKALMQQLLTGKKRFAGFEGEWEVGNVVPDGWSLMRLKDAGIKVFDGDRGKEYPNSTDLQSSGYCLFLSAKNVTKNGFKFNETIFISEKKHNKLRNGLVRRGNIVLTTRGSVGQFAIFSDEIPFKIMRINSGMVVLDASESAVKPEFVYALAKSNLMEKQISRAAFGSAQPQLTVSIINNLKLPVPPVSEQQRIAKVLTNADNEIGKLNSRLAHLKQEKKALMQQLLTGKRRVKVDG